jgi:hypothetical protein
MDRKKPPPQENQRLKSRPIKKINFRGLAIGDGLMDPAVQCDYASFLYGIGLIDLSAKAIFQAEQDKMIDLIGQKEWLKAFEVPVLVQMILFYCFRRPRKYLLRRKFSSVLRVKLN